MVKVSNVIKDVMSSCSDSSALLLAINIANSWEAIIGSDLCNASSLKNIKYTGKNKITIYINILSAASTIAKYSENEIKVRIEKQLNISDITLVFKHCTNIPRINTISSIEDSKTENIKYTINEGFENQSLKFALESLKTEIQNAA